MVNLTINQLQKRITYWKRKLGLHDWEFNVYIVDEIEDADYECIAQVETWPHYDTANIKFAQKWEDQDALEIERIIVHELLHVRRRDYYTAQRSIKDRLAPGVASLWEDSLRHEDEKDVEWLARLIVQLDNKEK